MAIAIGTLVGCSPMMEQNENRCFVQYHPDLWCHLYDNVIALPEPFPVKGQMGFFNVPDEQNGINLLEWYKNQTTHEYLVLNLK